MPLRLGRLLTRRGRQILRQRPVPLVQLPAPLPQLPLDLDARAGVARQHAAAHGLQLLGGQLKFPRGVLVTGAGLIVASTITQWFATDAWFDRPDVIQMMGEISRVVKRYPQSASIIDAFACGEVARRVWGIVVGFVLLALVVPGVEVWVEGSHERTLTPLREWEHNPEAYARRLVQDGTVRLSGELLNSEA